MIRRTVGRLMTTAGLVLMVSGVGLQSGLLAYRGSSAATPPPGDTGRATTSPPSSAPLATGADEPDVSSPPPTVTAAPGPTAAPGASASTVWFADEFDVQGGWPTGGQGDLTLGYADGAYVLEAPRTDLPLVIVGATLGSSPSGPITVEAELELDPGRATASAGLAIGDGAGARLLVVFAPDGSAGVYRDSLESLDLIASGSVGAASGARRLTATISPDTVVVSLDGQQVARVSTSIAGREFGLAVWSWEGPASVRVLRYEVRSGA